MALLERGQERFRIYCTPCHSELGDGHGMIVQRGFPPPPSYHIARLRDAPMQHFYDVITNGYGAMYSFAYRVQPEDRWAIAAYIRALQHSQDAEVSRADAGAAGGAAMRPAFLVGTAGLAVAALGWGLDAPRFYAGWLASFTLLGAWSLGSMALLLVHALTGGRWGDALRPALLLGVCTLPLLLPAAIPFVSGLAPLYPWARPEDAAHLANRFYLNLPFFALRGVIYLVVWFTLGALVMRGRSLHRIAPAGLFLLAITTTFAAMDTTMSLDPHFVSSIYGMMAATGMVLLALSIAVLLSAARAPAAVVADFGKLLQALVILWIYLDFMQLLIVWQSDLSSEAPWYLDRSRGFWGAMRIVIAVGHFVLPFFLLVSPRLQRSRQVVIGVAALLVVMEVLRSWWTVLPSLGETVGWIDIGCMLGVGGLAAGVALWAGRRFGTERLHA